jgi:hypothetical protein
MVWLTGFTVSVFGAIFKAESFVFASEVLIVGKLLQAIGGILILYKLITHPKVQDFLNQ